MRFYAFSHFMLSPIQQGIQSAHCLADMFLKYQSPTEQYFSMCEWARNHKTMIILNGGNSADLNELYLTLRTLSSEFILPFECFHEDEQSLNGAMTCVGAIVHPRVYEAAAILKVGGMTSMVYPDDLTVYEKQLAGIIASKPLAR